jgi:hypothetical protein
VLLNSRPNRRLQFHKRSPHFFGTHNAVIRVYDNAGNVTETHEHIGVPARLLTSR